MLRTTDGAAWGIEKPVKGIYKELRTAPEIIKQLELVKSVLIVLLVR